jgi:hypothetical protein
MGRRQCNLSEQDNSSAQAPVSKRATLSLREEMLLMKFYDKECSWFERCVSEVLLKRKKLARLFVDVLQKESEVCRDFCENIDNPVSFGKDFDDGIAVDLWDRVERRILQEEKSAIFQGARIQSSDLTGARLGILGQEKEEVGSFTSWMTRGAWGASGAFLTASALLLFQSPSLKANAPVSFTSNIQSYVPVALQEGVVSGSAEPSTQVSNQINGAPVTTMVSSPYEVEWLRSDGRVRIVDSDSRHSAPIIFIKKNKSQGKERNHPVSE